MVPPFAVDRNQFIMSPRSVDGSTRPPATPLAPNSTDRLQLTLLSAPGLPWGRNFYPHTHPIPTENLVGIPTGSPYPPTEPQNPTYPYPHPVFSLQEAYFNLLFVTLAVGYYMMYVLCESVCD